MSTKRWSPHFVLAMFSISIAWTSFSWFGSAFDTDDWLCRTLTMVQMVGVVIFSLGVPAMFHSLEEGHHMEMRLMVFGYVVMRVAIILQWLRVDRSSQTYRRIARGYVGWTILTQISWIAVTYTHLSIVPMLALSAVVGILECVLPRLAQGPADSTPWHPHHLAERFGLFAIIVLGESVVGTVASSSELLGGASGIEWSGNAAAVVVVGIGLTFGMWWMYFMSPYGEVLGHRRRRGYLYVLGHIPMFTAIAAVGGGLHIAGLYLEHHSHLTQTEVVGTIAAPVGLYIAMIYVLHTLLLSSADAFHFVLIALSAAVIAAGVILSALGAPLAVCLLVLMLAPLVTVIGYETIGHRHQADMLGTIAGQ